MDLFLCWLLENYILYVAVKALFCGASYEMTEILLQQKVSSVKSSLFGLAVIR